MPFTGTGSGIQNANDIFFSTLAQDNVLRYDAPTSKWNNVPASGFVALATAGGQEGLVTSSVTGNRTVNILNANVFDYTVTGNVTFTFTNAVAGKACAFTMYLHQDGIGGRLVTWPASTKWPGGLAPTLTSTANAIDVFVFESLDGGTTWYGSHVGADYK